MSIIILFIIKDYLKLVTSDVRNMNLITITTQLYKTISRTFRIENMI